MPPQQACQGLYEGESLRNRFVRSREHDLLVGMTLRLSIFTGKCKEEDVSSPFSGNWAFLRQRGDEPLSEAPSTITSSFCN